LQIFKNLLLNFFFSYLSPTLSFVGDYTLVLKKNGRNRSIRIYCTDGKYDFIKNGQFSSVVELIEYFRDKTLERYNSILNICLLYPIERSKYSQSDESCKDYSLDNILEKFKEVTDNLKILYYRFEQLNNKKQSIKQQIDEHRQKVAVLEEGENLFKAQLEIFLTNQFKVQLHHQEALKETGKELKEAFLEFEDERKYAQKELNKTVSKLPDIEAKIKKNKLEIDYHLRFEEKLKEVMIDNNIMPQTIIGVGQFNDEKHWFFKGFGRDEAKTALRGAPIGTFLLRPSSHENNYALSIMLKTGIKHCRIYCNENKRLSFKQENCVSFRSIKELVLYYSFNSLAKFNSELPTRLEIPLVTFLIIDNCTKFNDFVYPSLERIVSVQENIYS
jgi:phosphoinositide-3-kinase regulatory subunit